MSYRLSTSSLNQTPFDWSGNFERISSAISSAKKNHADLLLFPELSISGYGLEDGFYFPKTVSSSIKSLGKILEETDGIAVLVGLPLYHENILYNAACLLQNKEIKGIYFKQNLANYGIHYEKRWFSAWPAGKTIKYKLLEQEVMAGDIVFEFKEGVRLSVEICHDAWVENRPLEKQNELGVDIVLNPSASHFAFSKYDFVRNLILNSSKKYSLNYLYANLLGNEAGKVVYDGASFISSSKKMEAEAKRFNYEDFSLTIADLEIKPKNKAIKEVSNKIVKIPQNLKSHKAKQELKSSKLPDILSKHEEFSQSVSLGLFDYLRKSRTKGFVVSLSGGADSAATSLLVYYMSAYAEKSLGLEGLKKRLGFESTASSLKDLRKEILTCVYQKTSSSTKITEDSATAIANALFAEYFILDLDEQVESYKKLVSNALSWTPDWKKDDISLQNIQARTRAPSVWLIANLKNKLLLVTSNRSECSVGYSTMDGDTAGGLSPIAGADKAFIKNWLIWAEKEGSKDIGPLSELSYVNAQAPTAELRPGGEQEDEKDLMPYPVLDMIERLMISEKKSPKEIIEILKDKQVSKDHNEIKGWVEKFFKLWSRSQWKRERHATSFHLDDYNIEPSSGFRYPVLSGDRLEE